MRPDQEPRFRDGRLEEEGREEQAGKRRAHRMMGMRLASAKTLRHTSASSSALDRMLKKTRPRPINTVPGASRAESPELESTTSPRTTLMVPIATTHQAQR